MKFFLCFLFICAFFIGVSFSQVLIYAHTLEDPFIIQMTDKGFLPTEVTIPLGSQIRFENIGKQAHWPASNLHPTHGIYPEFDSRSPILAGKSWTFIFKKEGTWRLHDHLYPEFAGTIIVLRNNNRSLEKDNYIDWNFTTVLDRTLWLGKMKLFQIYADFHKKYLLVEFQKKNIYKIVDSKKDLEFWLATIGSSAVMNKLIKTAGDGKRLQCHRQAHAIGRGAYILNGIKAFKDGDASCSSGFYHGVMEAYIENEGSVRIENDIIAICSSFKTKFEQFHCFHGAGHGIMAYLNNDLPKAVAVCMRLSIEYGKSPCLNGIFMENIVAGTTKGDHTTKWLSSDPHFPCNRFDKELFIVDHCYQMQTSWISYLYKLDFDLIMSECLRAPQQSVASCYRSFGKDIGLYVYRDPKKILHYCNRLSNNKKYYDACITGALYDILDFWGFNLQNQGENFCRSVLAIGREQCYLEIEKRKKNLKEL